MEEYAVANLFKLRAVQPFAPLVFDSCKPHHISSIVRENSIDHIVSEFVS